MRSFFVQEAFRHCKTLGASGECIQLVAAANLPGIDLAGEATKSKIVSHNGVVTSRADIKTLVREFIEAMKQHRHFDRADKQGPA